MKILISIFILAVASLQCGPYTPDPQRIIDQAITVHGGELFQNSSISFTFRGRHYTSSRQGGEFEYTRNFTDSLGEYRDVLNNDGFTRYLNSEVVNLTEEWKSRYAASVNSVLYFALLPYGLNDEAVNKKFLREESIKGEPFQLIQVTFQEEGGGEDFQDVFYYWIHRDKHTLNYLAYYYDTEEKGVRFREAFNVRNIHGVQIQDYINYKPEKLVPLDELIPLFEKNELKSLSKIELEEVKISD